MIRICWIAALAISISTALPVPGHSATFQVTKTADTNDGLCNADCSLREAVNAFRAAAILGGIHQIDIPAGTYVLTRAGAGEDNGATGDLDITGISNNTILDIQGAGRDLTIIDADGLDRVLHIVAANAQIGIADLTLRGGLLGVGAGDGGGIHNQSTLTLERVALLDNQSDSSTSFGGGGLFSTRAVTLVDCAVEGNVTVGGDGGGIHARSALTLTDTTIHDNHADGVSGAGGGIASVSDLMVTTSTISANSAGAEGGGLVTERDVHLTNSTVSGNTSGQDGSQLALSLGDGGQGVLTHVTVVSMGAELAIVTDGVIDVTAANSIVDGGCATGALRTLGGNVESPGSTCFFGHVDDQDGVSPQNLALSALADHGGPTLTHALGSSSAATDAGRAAQCSSVDQRGQARPVDGDGDDTADCDAGSYELVPLFVDGFETGDMSRWSSATG